MAKWLRAKQNLESLLKMHVKDDRLRVDGDKNMRLLSFAFTIALRRTRP